MLEDRRRAGDVRTDQRIKEGVIQKQMRGKIKEWLTKEQRRMKKDINKEESNNEREKKGHIDMELCRSPSTRLSHSHVLHVNKQQLQTSELSIS